MSAELVQTDPDVCSETIGADTSFIRDVQTCQTTFGYDMVTRARLVYAFAPVGTYTHRSEPETAYLALAGRQQPLDHTEHTLSAITVIQYRAKQAWRPDHGAQKRQPGAPITSISEYSRKPTPCAPLAREGRGPRGLGGGRSSFGRQALSRALCPLPAGDDASALAKLTERIGCWAGDWRCPRRLRVADRGLGGWQVADLVLAWLWRAVNAVPGATAADGRLATRAPLWMQRRDLGTSVDKEMQIGQVHWPFADYLRVVVPFGLVIQKRMSLMVILMRMGCLCAAGASYGVRHRIGVPLEGEVDAPNAQVRALSRRHREVARALATRVECLPYAGVALARTSEEARWVDGKGVCLLLAHACRCAMCR